MTFTYSITAADWARIAPELVLTVITLLVMLADLFVSPPGKNVTPSKAINFIILPLLSLLGIAGAFVATIILFVAGDQQPAFNQMIGSDFGSLYAYIIILSASGLGILLSADYLKRLKLVHQGEYYALFLLATIGMMLMAAATSFMTVFLGLEMLSLALYILCGFVSQRKSSQESGMKYFLLSSFASAFLLYGIALTYAATGNTSFAGIRTFLLNKALSNAHLTHVPPHFDPSLHGSALLLVATGLLIVGFAFKVSAIPFQAWTPDVYDGAPAPVTGFMSVGTKAAALIAFARVFDVVFHTTRGDWMPVVWAITILTIIGGNILALVQGNVKRLLAYSSIAHAGYLLIGVVVGGIVGLSSILFYLLCYTFLNLGAFGVVSVLERIDNSGSSYSEIRGLWYRRPLLAGLLAVFIFALAGFPPMAGFAGKYYLFYAALVGGHPELLIIGVLASVLGMYYYLRVAATMFMEKEPIIATSVPATPAPTGRRNSTRSGNTNLLASPSSRSGATAVAVKPATKAANTSRATAPTTRTIETGQPAQVGVMSWIALGIAFVGMFAMGTVLPFWLVGLAQQAAQMMLR